MTSKLPPEGEISIEYRREGEEVVLRFSLSPIISMDAALILLALGVRDLAESNGTSLRALLDKIEAHRPRWTRAEG